MEFFTQFPVMERVPLMELKKGIDLSFRLFSRKYGDAIESFFDPLLFFLFSINSFKKISKQTCREVSAGFMYL